MDFRTRKSSQGILSQSARRAVRPALVQMAFLRLFEPELTPPQQCSAFVAQVLSYLPVTFWKILLCCIVSAWIAFLRAGLSRHLSITQNVARYSGGMVLVVMFVGFFALGSHQPEESSSLRLPQPTVPFLKWLTDAPVTGFALLLASEIISWGFNRLGPNQHFLYLRYPSMAVHTAALAYYALEPTLYVEQDVFGRPVVPLRYVMWSCSTSSMCIIVYFLVDAIHCEPGNQRDMRKKLQDSFLHALLCVVCMFVTGYLASCAKVFEAVGAAGCFALITACFAAFLNLLSQVVFMFSRAEAQPTVRQRGLQLQFVAVRRTTVVAWCIFPAVWCAAAAGIISPEIEHVGYVCGDLLAKNHMLFVYLMNVTP